MRVDDGRVVEFNEKPTVADGIVSGGFFVLEREVFDYLDDDPGSSRARPLQKTATASSASCHEGFWRRWTPTATGSI
jgi:glucose-1-phosphate cytidylyltransferase